MLTWRLVGAVFLSLTLVALTPAGVRASFTGIGALPNVTPSSQAADVSGDGSVVVGTSLGDGQRRPFRLVPEPSTALLLAFGLAGLAVGGGRGKR